MNTHSRFVQVLWLLLPLIVPLFFWYPILSGRLTLSEYLHMVVEAFYTYVLH